MAFNPSTLYSAQPVEKSAAVDTKHNLESQINKKNNKKTDHSLEKQTTKSSSRVELSEKAKELQKDLSNVEKAMKIHGKKFGDLEKPGIYFVSGFDWFGASFIKGNYDGIRDMAEAIEGAKHYSWDQEDEIIEDIKKRKPDQPVILVGHSFGGDGAVEIANRLNTIENGFRKIDLLITLDSVGTDNDFIPQNVKKNLNFLAQGPYRLINDGPNIARNYERTQVKNFLRPEEHADLDDTTDIQITILEEVENVLKNA